MSNQARYTPGPWNVDEAPDLEVMAECLQAPDCAWVAVEDTADDGGHVAYCHPANAHLIAASPDLLEREKDAIEFMESVKSVIENGLMNETAKSTKAQLLSWAERGIIARKELVALAEGRA